MVVAWGCCFFLAACARALRRVVQVPAILCCEAMVWALTFLAFPLRMLTAAGERKEAGQRVIIGEMQAQMEVLVWVNRELEEKLQAALREHDAMLDEMEDEQEDAYARIDALEAQLKALRQENMRLNEHKGKSMWDNRAPEPETKQTKAPRLAMLASGTEQGALAGTTQEDDGAGLKLVQPADPASVLSLTTATAPAAAAIAQQANDKAVARGRSLFSLGMSLAVGGVACSADAACLPLLAGLFAVVGVSMRSVSRCCPRRGDAVSLLSLNWFLLGVLTSPMLPAVARAGRALGPAFASLT
ncbi:unnamed protein product [Urochloa decumbens]|uniref:Uncharacterized protein n=1 Tax=Urochloa decumbens TaxID=240449 RepID=A0ABC9H2T9_9POAL